jgi:hypothetical protein
MGVLSQTICHGVLATARADRAGRYPERGQAASSTPRFFLIWGALMHCRGGDGGSRHRIGPALSLRNRIIWFYQPLLVAVSEGRRFCQGNACSSCAARRKRVASSP